MQNISSVFECPGKAWRVIRMSLSGWTLAVLHNNPAILAILPNTISPQSLQLEQGSNNYYLPHRVVRGLNESMYIEHLELCLAFLYCLVQE